MMSRPCFRAALLLILAPATSADDFRDLFDGKSLDGWVVEGPAKVRGTPESQRPGRVPESPDPRGVTRAPAGGGTGLVQLLGAHCTHICSAATSQMRSSVRLDLSVLRVKSPGATRLFACVVCVWSSPSSV
jgi:hypothetical protein